MTIKMMTRFVLPVVMSVTVFIAHSQETKNNNTSQNEAAIKKMIDGKSFIFEPRSVKPMKGGVRYLDPGYMLKINGDSLVCDMPYFGRAYQGGYGSNDGGLKATSAKFDYAVTSRKKGGWEISIKTNDVSDRMQFNLTVFEDGSASVYVNSNTRDPISFDGNIEPIKVK